MSAPPEIRILVVDDDPFFLRVLEKRFGAEGYRVLTATNGREGMRQIVAGEPHLVVSDWMMPEVDGLELCQSVKTGLREAAPYFILLTAKGEMSDRVMGLETGADDFVVKPCEHAELMARVRAGLRIVRLTEALRRAAAGGAAAAAGDRDAAGGDGSLSWCARCHRVRGADGAWRPVEAWLRERAGAAASCDCPDCGAEPGRAAA